MAELKRCPFCGGCDIEIVERNDDRDIPKYYFVHCVGCSAKGPTAWSLADAEKEWNRRADNG